MTIEHSFNFNVPAKDIFQKLILKEHLSNWWTQDCQVEPIEGIVGHFHWKGHGWTVEMQIEKLIPDQRVEWKCLRSNMQDTNAWVGSQVIFVLKETEFGKTQLYFKHEDYQQSKCFDVCHDGWKFVLGKSLKDYAEIGAGQPYRSELKFV